MELSDITKIKNTIPSDVRIVCATKYVEAEDMLKLFNVGLKDFGENRVEAFLNKYHALKNYDITWHFIGHLQTNKASKIINEIDYLHSLSSIKLAKIISKARKTPLKCFIEVNINAEESKSGIAVSELIDFVKEIKDYPNLEIIGLMGMSKSASSKEDKLKQFKYLADLQKDINAKLGLNLAELSMGMSDDYLEAIKAGATFIRLGRILWTQKN